jgi:hypothetical protein
MIRIHGKCIRIGAALVASSLAMQVAAKPADIDPKADQVLRAMAAYLGGLKQFSARTENTMEMVTQDGQKLQFIAPAAVTVARPDKLFAERRGDIVNQQFFYNGKTLTQFNPDTKLYATAPAPATVDAALDFARDELDIIAPAADLLDTRVYERLMQQSRSGSYLGLSSVGGHRCHHLAYRADGVDWQIWVREGDQPLPCRYVITTTDLAASPQFTIQFNDWDVAPKIPAGLFDFTAPAGATAIEFLRATPATEKK